MPCENSYVTQKMRDTCESLPQTDEITKDIFLNEAKRY